MWVEDGVVGAPDGWVVVEDVVDYGAVCLVESAINNQ